MSLTLADALRYFLSGVVVLVYWRVFDWASNCHDGIEAILKGRESGVVASVALAGGAIAYILYRVFYETIIVGLQDYVCRLSRTDNYRTFLRGRYIPRLSRLQAERLYVAISHAEHIEPPGSTLTGIFHFGYMSGLAAIVFAGLSAWRANYCPMGGFAALAIVILVATFLLDRWTEAQELDSLRLVNPQWKIDRITDTLFAKNP